MTEVKCDLSILCGSIIPIFELPIFATIGENVLQNYTFTLHMSTNFQL